MRNSNKAIERRQRSIDKRLDRSWQPERAVPVMERRNVCYEVSDRVEAMPAGGMGMIVAMVDRLGLREALDRNVRVLKRHRPYHESDHILAMAFNLLCGGHCLEDLELLRRDEAFLNCVSARRIPDPTTAGDFLRRFDDDGVTVLLDSVQTVRAAVWQSQPPSERKLARIDVDGTITQTDGRCKEKMDVSYDGRWGFVPLLVTLANSQEILYVYNRPANRPSHDGAAPWLDKAASWAIEQAGFERVRFRGDTDFSQTAHLDRWTKLDYEFVFGLDAHPALVKRAQNIAAAEWKLLGRTQVKRAKTRAKAPKVKDEVIARRDFKDLTLEEEHFAELSYRPSNTKRDYRLIVLRKRIRVQKGQLQLADEIRYFFYISNIEGMAADELIRENNQRCNQENVIEQFKNGVHGARLPVREFAGNWAYMAIAALAWSLKAWIGLLLPKSFGAVKLIRMEFRKFLREVMLQPAQILKTGRRLVVRLLAVNPWTRLLLDGTKELQAWSTA